MRHARGATQFPDIVPRHCDLHGTMPRRSARSCRVTVVSPTPGRPATRPRSSLAPTAIPVSPALETRHHHARRADPRRAGAFRTRPSPRGPFWRIPVGPDEHRARCAALEQARHAGLLDDDVDGAALAAYPGAAVRQVLTSSASTSADRAAVLYSIRQSVRSRRLMFLRVSSWSTSLRDKARQRSGRGLRWASIREKSAASQPCRCQYAAQPVALSGLLGLPV